MKKLIARLTRPVPFLAVALSGLVSVLIDPVGGRLFGLFPGILLFCNLCFYLLDALVRRLKGPEAVRDNLIELNVDDVVYGRLQEMAAMTGLSVSEFCRCVLQALEPDEMAAAEPFEEVHHG